MIPLLLEQTQKKPDLNCPAVHEGYGLHCEERRGHDGRHVAYLSHYRGYVDTQREWIIIRWYDGERAVL